MKNFEYQEFLELARELASSSDFASNCSEAKYRSAISRAYYAVFLTGKLVSGDFNIRHEDLIARIKKQDEYIADRVRSLKLKREDADYDKSVPYKMENEVQACLDEASELITEIAKWTDLPKLTDTPIRRRS